MSGTSWLRQHAAIHASLGGIGWPLASHSALTRPPDPADLTRVRKDHDVPKPRLELLNPSLAPLSLEGALEELADRDEGDAHDLAADVFVQGGRKGSSLKM